MKTTTVSVAVLLETLKENREKHIAEYSSARRIWEEKVVKRLSEVRREAGRGNFDNVEDPLRSLPKPVKFTSQYDLAIAKLEWETHEVVDLDQNEFVQYVQDQWSFSHQFIAATSMYNAA